MTMWNKDETLELVKLNKSGMPIREIRKELHLKFGNKRTQASVYGKLKNIKRHGIPTFPEPVRIKTLQEVRDEHIYDTYIHFNENGLKAAKSLGVTEKTFCRLIRNAKMKVKSDWKRFAEEVGREE